jgi:hypothetical protein
MDAAAVIRTDPRDGADAFESNYLCRHGFAAAVAATNCSSSPAPAAVAAA